MGSSEEFSTEKSAVQSPQQHDVSSGEAVDHGAESGLQRRLSSRHVTMIALGSSIGMGLWLGSGTSLANGGPAALFIGCKCLPVPRENNLYERAWAERLTGNERRHPLRKHDLVRLPVDW